MPRPSGGRMRSNGGDDQNSPIWKLHEKRPTSARRKRGRRLLVSAASLGESPADLAQVDFSVGGLLALHKASYPIQMVCATWADHKADRRFGHLPCRPPVDSGREFADTLRCEFRNIVSEEQVPETDRPADLLEQEKIRGVFQKPEVASGALAALSGFRDRELRRFDIRAGAVGFSVLRPVEFR